MPFQFNQIDKIADFDEAIEVLEESYIGELINQFLQSPEGQAYLQASGEDEDLVGDWIGNFILFGYAYLQRTLGKMRQVDAENILLDLFPSHLTVLNPSILDTVIPELKAFWQFLQRQYKPRNSKKILTLLETIAPRFQQAMTDSSNFGMAKSFMLAGEEAGFDMTTQEGVSAFQQQYNQQLQATGAPPPGVPGLQPIMAGSSGNPLANYPIPDGVPPEFVALLSQQMGLGAVPGLEHLPTDPGQLAQAIAQHLVASGEVELTGGVGSLSNFNFGQQLQVNTLSGGEEAMPLSDAAIALLRDQTITETIPGTIVKDFETVLSALGDRGLPVSSKLHQFPAKVLVPLNADLSQPIQIDLKRPVQKSFPNLHGMYLLLRATGMAQVEAQGKQHYLRLNPDIFASWKTLNPTEKYFTLLEAWTIRGNGELLGDQQSRLNEGTRILHTWQHFAQKSKTFGDYSQQQSLDYWPGFYNLALMQLFGWLDIESPEPSAGKGWRVRKISLLPLGDAMVAMVMSAYAQQGFLWESQNDFTQPWGDLQPFFEPYFPEWENNLVSLNPIEHQLGTYIFNVSLGKAKRRISVSSEAPLDKLAGLILDSVDFDHDHLYLFSFRDRMGRMIEIHHPYNDWQDGPGTDQVLIGDLPLQPGASMTYLFDFGDNWEFQVVLEEIQPGKPKRSSNKILERKGKAPEQYPDWDDD
ncbi:MAG: plasmid pRiA4b ORF-3 family protein [Cyanobacteria bacterium J06638_22]